MSESLGAARLDVAVSSDQAVSGLSEIERKVKLVGATTVDTNTKASNSIERHIKRLEMQNATLGKTSSEVELYKLKLKGATDAQLASAESILKQIDAFKKLTPEIDKNTISAKQQAFALRGVPAQFTDIVTSLQGGQAPLTVFLQQGGQLKDMFGGAGNAARALGGYVVGLINPFTIAAAAVGTLGFAAYQGAKEQEAFAKALIMTGNAAGVTIGQLSTMAKTISDTSSFTQGAAAAALAAFAADGNAPRDKLQSYAKVALGLEREMGISVSDTVKQFSELGKDPVGASIKLNESTRFLTMSVYLQIRALADQGKTVEAGRLAQEAYANVMNVRIPEMTAHLGTLERAVRSTTGAFKYLWDAALGVGREETPEQKLVKLQANIEAVIAKARSGPKYAQPSDAALDAALEPQREQLKLLKQSIAAEQQKATNAAADQKRIKDHQDYDALHNQYLSKEALLEKEIANIRETGKRAGVDSKVIAADVAAATRKSRGPGFDDAITKSLQAQALASIKAGLEAEVLEYTNADKLLSAAHSLRLIDDKYFYEEQLKLIRAKGAAEVVGLEAEIATAKLAKFTGDNRVQQTIDNQTKINELEAKLNTSRTNTTASINQNAFEVAAANIKIKRSYDDAAAAASNYLKTVQRQYAREVGGIGKGDEFRQKQGALGAIEDRKISTIEGLDSQLRKKSITQAEYDDKVALAKKAYDDEVAAYLKSRTDIKSAQSDWTNGYTEAMANFVTESRNTAGQVSNIFKSTFDGISQGIGDSFARSLVHGESLKKGLIGSINSVAVSAISSFVKMQVSSYIANKLILANKVATDQAGAASGIEAKTEETAASVELSALEAAAGAFKAIVGIPVVGPALAVGASLAALSFVRSLMGGSGGGGESTTTVINQNPYPTNTAIPLAGARALGGPVAAGSLYEVNERGPEIFTTQNRDYLMVGGKGGFVTPNGGARGSDMSSLASEPVTNIHVNVMKNPNGNYELTPAELGKLLIRGKRDNVKGFANV